jgi:hypothetical protein
MAALDDRPPPGKAPTITAEAKAWIADLACRKAKELGYPHELWTTRLLARHAREHGPAAGHLCLAKLAQGTLCKILNQQEIKPHKVRYYLERRDPQFKRKMADVLCVYREVEPRLHLCKDNYAAGKRPGVTEHCLRGRPAKPRRAGQQSTRFNSFNRSLGSMFLSIRGEIGVGRRRRWQACRVTGGVANSRRSDNVAFRQHLNRYGRILWFPHSLNDLDYGVTPVAVTLRVTPMALALPVTALPLGVGRVASADRDRVASVGHWRLSLGVAIRHGSNHRSRFK